MSTLIAQQLAFAIGSRDQPARLKAGLVFGIRGLGLTRNIVAPVTFEIAGAEPTVFAFNGSDWGSQVVHAWGTIDWYPPVEGGPAPPPPPPDTFTRHSPGLLGISMG